MDPRRRAIAELGRRSAEHAVEARTQLQRLGEFLSAQEATTFSDPEFQEAQALIRELRRQLPASRQQARRIMQCMENNAELDAKLRSVGERYAELERENDSIGEDIGRSAYTFYRDNSHQFPSELAELFDKVDRQEQELHTLQEDQERSRSTLRTGNLFKIIGEAGRGFFLRSAVNFKRKAVARAYAEAGRTLCESEAVDRIGDAALRRRMSPYLENRKRLQELVGERESLQAAQAELWGELKGLGADKSYQRRVRELERNIQDAERELEETCRRLGELFRARPVRSLATDPEVKNRLRRAALAEKQQEKNQKRIRRIEAAMQIDALDAQTRSMRDKIDKLTREIRAREQEVRTLEKQIQEASEEREALVKARGPEHTLLEVDELEGEEAGQ
jgi:chromosome segregation ATPase